MFSCVDAMALTDINSLCLLCLPVVAFALNSLAVAAVVTTEAVVVMAAAMAEAATVTVAVAVATAASSATVRYWAVLITCLLCCYVNN